MANPNEEAQDYTPITPGAEGLHEVDSLIHKDLKRFMPSALSEYRSHEAEGPNMREEFEAFYQAVIKETVFAQRIH